MEKTYLDKLVEKQKRRARRRLKTKWKLGFNDRGLGRGDFGIILDLKRPARPVDLVAGPMDREIAEHIIKLHNESLVD